MVTIVVWMSTEMILVTISRGEVTSSHQISPGHVESFQQNSNLSVVPEHPVPPSTELLDIKLRKKRKTQGDTFDCSIIHVLSNHKDLLCRILISHP